MLTKAKKKQSCLVACIVSVELDAYGIRKTPNVDVGTTGLCVPMAHTHIKTGHVRINGPERLHDGQR